MPAHTALAKLDAVPDDVIEAVRDGTPIADPKLEALRTFTVQVVNKRGWVTDHDVQAFLDDGYTQQQILEVILGLAHKVRSNYTNHVAKTPVDASAALLDRPFSAWPGSCPIRSWFVAPGEELGSTGASR